MILYSYFPIDIWLEVKRVCGDIPVLLFAKNFSKNVLKYDSFQHRFINTSVSFFGRKISYQSVRVPNILAAIVSYSNYSLLT